MTYEGSTLYGEQVMSNTTEINEINEAITQRDHLYVAASLYDIQSCADDRLAQLGLQMFGGVAYLTYNRCITEEVTTPGSMQDKPFDNEIQDDTADLKDKGFQPGVHSDNKCEHGDEFNLNQHEGPIGCAYINSRQLISQTIVDNAESIIIKATGLYPELFSTGEGSIIAHQVIAAHSRMLTYANYFKAGGRSVALSAVKAGAKPIVVKGDHIARVGIMNGKIGTTLDTARAINEDLPAYNHNQWAVDAINEARGVMNPRLQKIAEIIDAIGVFITLDVPTIGRRD